MESVPESNKMLAIYEGNIFKRITFPLFNDSPRKSTHDRKKTLKYVFNKIRLKKCASATISKPMPTYHVAYLGNVVTGWAKGEGCIEKPLTTLWRNYIQSSRPDVSMTLTISGGGLKALTKNHGLTEYWAHRLTTCAAPKEFPRIFCWIYRHEGRRLRHELRCHAALCSSSDVASQIERDLKEFLAQALTDFKKEKLLRQNARLSLVNSIQENPSLPRRKILLGTGCHNYKPPLECSKSAPRLSSIEEMYDEEDDNCSEIYKKILKSYERANYLYEKFYEYGSQYNMKYLINRWKTEQNKLYNKISEIRAFSSKNADKVLVSKVAECATKEEITLNHETEDKKCDSMYINGNSSLCEHRVSFVSVNVDVHQDNIETAKNVVKQEIEVEKSIDLDFKIGGEVLPPIKDIDKLPNVEHPFVTPIINKGFIEQEQVSLVPVGEQHSDFSSLKVYKRRNSCEVNKDFPLSSIFLPGESMNHLDTLYQANCSFNGDRSEEELANKFNSSLLV